jgi:hypothetical protein
MAYTPNSLAMRSGGFIEGTFGVWEYTSVDALSLILAPGYFTDGSSKGMLVGDIVWVVNQTAPSVSKCQCSASTVTTTGGLTQHVGAATIILANDWNLYSNPRNVLDGGDATINPWQRGTSVTASSATTVTYAADRWFLSQAVTATSAYMAKFANSSTTGTLAIQGFTQAFSWGRTQSSGSVSTLYVGQVLESLDSVRLQGQTVSFSFWAAGNTGFTAGQASSLIGVTLVQGYGSDQSATSCVAGTWTTSQNVISATQVITSTMTRYAFSGIISNTAQQVGVLLSYTPTATTATTAETVLMNGFQLEIGGLTPFEHREIEQELAYCQRFYFQASEPGTSGTVIAPGMFNSTNSALFMLTLPVQMRIAPTVTVTQGSFGALSASNAYIALTSMAAGSTHTVNYISVTGAATAASGFATMLISSSASVGKILVTADL